MISKHRRQPKGERESINIYFANYTTSATITCFDEESEMHIIVRDGKKMATYTMTMDEVKDLKKWLNTCLKNENG